MNNPSLGGLSSHTPSQLQMAAQSQSSLVAGGVDPRTGGPSLTTMQQLSVLSPHQRQLFLMQQQHRQQQHQQQQQQQQSQPQPQQQQQQPQQQQLPARNSGINNNLGPSGLVTQQFGGGNLPTTAALLHQRQQQARLQQSQQQSQLGEAAAFTATGPVSSNTGIPGIARSTRSPSDSTHSPLTPRGPQQQLQQLQQQQQSQSQQQPSGMDYQRALMMDAARGQVGSPAPGPGFANAQPLANTFGAGMGAVNTGALANTNGSYSVSPPGSAHSRTSFPGTAAAPSPSATTSGNWQTGGPTMNANGGWQGAPGAAAGMGGGIGGTMGLDPNTFAYGDTQAFGTDGLVMDPMADPPGIEFNDIFNIPG